MRPVILYDDDEQPIKLPMERIVCPTCRGEGKIVNPAIDGHGIPADDECWDDDDFREGYFGGRYDVICPECDGRNVIDIVDEDALIATDPELYRRYVDAWSQRRSDEAAEEMERRYCGGW